MSPAVLHLWSASTALTVSSPIHQNMNTAGTTSYSQTITLPASAAAGDALIAVHAIHADATLTDPSDWSVLVDMHDSSRADGRVYYRVLDASDITAGTVGITVGASIARYVTFQAFHVTGCDTTALATPNATVAQSALEATLTGCTAGNSVLAVFVTRNVGYVDPDCGVYVSDSRGFEAAGGFYYACGPAPASAIAQMWVGSTRVVASGSVSSPLFALDVLDSRAVALIELERAP